MVDKNKTTSKKALRALGVHLTPKDIFREYILPEIEDKLNSYLWVDLYCGKGNLILPILELIPENQRSDFFSRHIFLSDIQEEMVQSARDHARSLGIPDSMARERIIIHDNLANMPEILTKSPYPIYHITNPPYLYLGYIRKHEETQKHLVYFQDNNDGLQDLYQVAMMNDLKNRVKNLIYIIPSNFIFGSSVSNQFRKTFLPYYRIEKMWIFETQIFDYTGTNICITFFSKKERPKDEPCSFQGVKFKKEGIVKRNYLLKPEYKYRGGSEFNEFTKKYRAKTPPKIDYYLQKEEIEQNNGDYIIDVIDTTRYKSKSYEKIKLSVNQRLKMKILSNILFIRTVDTGSKTGRAGLNEIKKEYDVDGVYVSGNTYRTSPIHLFLTPALSHEDQLLLKEYFNGLLEYFRDQLDSEFLTTYKYSKARYTRKYLGLTQIRKLIRTFPLLDLDSKQKYQFRAMIKKEDFVGVISFLDEIKKESQ